jgi:hypothetical protein
MFNFPTNSQPSHDTTPMSQRDVLMLFDYVDDEDESDDDDDEQSLRQRFVAKKYDVLSVLEVQDEWLSVRDRQGRDGFIPTAFTAPIDWSDVVYGSYKYAAQTAEQLSFERGDAVVVAKRYDDGWAEGVIIDVPPLELALPTFRCRPADRLRAGLFPLNFTSSLPKLPASKSASSSLASSVPTSGTSIVASAASAVVPTAAAAVVAGPPPTTATATSSSTSTSTTTAPTTIATTTRTPPTARIASGAPTHAGPVAGPSTRFECSRARGGDGSGELSEAELYRCKVVDEMVNTERDYIESLELMLRVFYEPLKANKLLDKKALQTLFGGIPELVALNRRLLAAMLDEANKPVGDKRMGEAFLRGALTVAMTEPYAAYCAQHQRAGELIREAASAKTPKGAEFAAWLKDVHATAALNLRPLSSFVILPVQRVCKYPLLLKELVKRTPAEHGDAEPLMRAQKAVEVLTAAVNERTKDIENQMKIAELVSRCAGLDKCNPQRYLRDGDFTDHSPQQKKGAHLCHLYLFTNCLVRAKPNKSKLRLKPLVVKEMIPIDLVVVADIEDTPALKNVIDISHMGTALKYRFVAPTADAKESWLIDFEKLLNEVRAEEVRLHELEKRRSSSMRLALSDHQPLTRTLSSGAGSGFQPGASAAAGRSGSLSGTLPKPLPAPPVAASGSGSSGSSSSSLRENAMRSNALTAEKSTWQSVRIDPTQPLRRGSGGSSGTSPKADSTTMRLAATRALGRADSSASDRDSDRESDRESDSIDGDGDEATSTSAEMPALPSLAVVNATQTHAGTATSAAHKSSRVFGSSKALELQRKSRDITPFMRPPSRPPPRLEDRGSGVASPPPPTTPAPPLTNDWHPSPPPLPSTPSPLTLSSAPSSLAPTAAAALSPTFIDDVLSGAKHVILAGKKLVLQRRALASGDAAGESPAALEVTARDLAKQTYSLLGTVSAALQDAPPSDAATQLHAVSKEARGAVLELVDASKVDSPAADAATLLEDQYKSLIAVVKNIVALSQAFFDVVAVSA